MNRIKQFLLITLVTLSLLVLLEILGRSLFFHEKAPHNSGILYLSKQIVVFLHNTVLKNNKPVHKKDGLLLNQEAWQATFKERGLTPPHAEPREGYWGDRVRPPKNEKFLRYVERPLDIPGLVHVDHDGFQHAVGNHKPDYSILILGGSVAYGAYASTYQNTYFSKLVHLLAQKGVYVEIRVLAAGAWVSTDELMAFVLKGLNEFPDMVVFFNGLNDLTNIDENYPQRTTEYLRNMEKVKTIAAVNGITTVYVLQPFLPGKKTLTTIEAQILNVTRGANDLVPYYDKMRQGLSRLHDGRQAHFIDCSRIFDREEQTTFTDIWHFTDPGHRLVAELLAEKMVEIIRSGRKGPDTGA